MIDVYVLDQELNTVAVIDGYKSLIWANRYRENGDCELYLEASARNINFLRMGYYLVRADDDMICRINKIELTTDTEDGNYLTVTGVDAKSILDQRIIWNTSSLNGNIEQFVRQLIRDALISPTDARRTVNLVTLGAAAGLSETATEQVSYKNLGEKIREYCTAYGWGYRFKVDENNKLAFELYAGTDRSENVMFSDQYENLSSSQYTDSCEKMDNVALIGGQGEGSARIKGTLGTAAGVDRYEQFIDADDLATKIKYKDLTAAYAGGSVIASGNAAIYRLSRLDVQIIDEEHLSWLQANYSGETVIIDGVRYYRLTNIAIADLPDTSPTEDTDVELREIIYHSYLLNRGVERLAEYGETESFEGTIIPDVTFIYKQDYFLGDIVNVENEFGISADARIIEIIESVDENGYSIEPTFEYLGINQTIQTYLLTQDGEVILAEDAESGLITEDSPIRNVAPTERPAGVKISELPQVTELDGSYYMPFATDSETVKASYTTLEAQVAADVTEAIQTQLDSKKNKQTAVGNPAASGTAVSFIDSISQNDQGVITPTKKTVRSATASQSGLMSATDKAKLDSMGMWELSAYTGAGDIKSIIDNLWTQINSNGLMQKPVCRRIEPSSNTVFGSTSSCLLIGKMSSVNYGFGILITDNVNNMAMWRRTGSATANYADIVGKKVSGYYYKNTNKSIASGTTNTQTIQSYTIPTAGFYIVSGFVSCLTSWSGVYINNILIKRGTSEVWNKSTRANALNGGGCENFNMLNLNAGDIIYSEAHQASGSARDMKSILLVVRLGDQI